MAGAIVVIAIGTAIAVRRWQPELPGMALCLAFVLLAAGVMNKQSFLNQWLATGLLLLALAPVSRRPTEVEERSGLATGGGPEAEGDRHHGERRQQAVT